jgi:hypothetical protein
MLGSTVRRWWARLGGRVAPSTPTAAPQNSVAGTARPPPAAEPGELQVVDDRKPSGADMAKHTGAAGFDPYSSDAGYQKPHSWERIDHD